MTPQEHMPELQEGMLDPAALDALIGDIDQHGELLEIAVKGGRTARAGASEATLGTVAELLTSGGAFAVQLRYRFDDAEWWDTLMRTPEGVRLVRIRHDWSQAPANQGGQP